MSPDRLGRKLRFAVRAWRSTALCSGILLTMGGVAALYLASLQYRLAVAGWTERALFDRGIVEGMVRAAPAFNGILIVSGILSFVFWLRWIYLSAVLVKQVSPQAIRYSPVAAVFGFLAPIVQFWMPIYTMVDIEEFAAGQTGGTAPMLPLRQAAIVLLALLSSSVLGVVFSFPFDDFSSPLIGQRIMTALAFAAVSVLALVLVADSFIRDVTIGEEAALRLLSERAAPTV